jgi:hypothetical protein
MLFLVAIGRKQLTTYVLDTAREIPSEKSCKCLRGSDLLGALHSPSMYF